MAYFELVFYVSIIQLALIAVLATLVWFRTFSKTRSYRYAAMFRFSDGKNIKAIDPTTAWVSLLSHPKMSNFISEFRDQGKPLSLSGNDIDKFARVCVGAAQSCFGVVAYSSPDMPGLTVTETIELLSRFIQYCELPKRLSS